MTKQKGFTLLELLVVIGIIALLLSAITISYTTAQGKSRDARRREDLKAMQGALEQYYAANSSMYPTTGCSTASTYINGAWPTTDPQGTAYSATCTSTSSYCICSQLEPGATGNSAAGCNWSGGTTHYCVKNMQ